MFSSHRLTTAAEWVLGGFGGHKGSDDIRETEEKEMRTHMGGGWNVGLLFESRSN